ncbi:MAG: aspartyl protease family protein [Planctomycetales bacterium]|nr:aspartyl protease family protein [bacterium]UNM07215.1 MAG: aspartyl protease family protein [Planctomycetales bacterium]
MMACQIPSYAPAQQEAVTDRSRALFSRVSELPALFPFDDSMPAEEVLQHHLDVMQSTIDYFRTDPVKLEFRDGDPEEEKGIGVWVQGKRFRQEHYWLGFTEVFGFDGNQHWYGSDMVLPYEVDGEGGTDVSQQYIQYMHYLSDEQQQYISAADNIPLQFRTGYHVLKYSPPGMSQLLLLIEPGTWLLRGMLQGNERNMDSSQIFRYLAFDDWQDNGEGCLYPQQILLRKFGSEGLIARDRNFYTTSVAHADKQPAGFFEQRESPAVAMPELPSVPYQLPFSYTDDSILVSATGPDGQRLRFKLDTGANVGLLRRDVARELGCRLLGDEEVTGHGGKADVQYTRVSGLKLNGRIPIPDFPAAVLTDGGKLEESMENGNVSGLLGSLILNNYIVRLDMKRKRMYLYPPEQFDPDLHLGSNYNEVSFHRDSLPWVDIVVDGAINGGAFINTGAQPLFTLYAWAIDRAGINYEIENIGSGVTIHGRTAFYIIRPDEVKVGTTSIRQPLTFVENLAPGEEPKQSRIGSFGNSMFLERIVTFDLHHQKLYLEEDGGS